MLSLHALTLPAVLPKHLLIALVGVVIFSLWMWFRPRHEPHALPVLKVILDFHSPLSREQLLEYTAGLNLYWQLGGYFKNIDDTCQLRSEEGKPIEANALWQGLHRFVVIFQPQSHQSLSHIRSQLNALLESLHHWADESQGQLCASAREPFSLAAYEAYWQRLVASHTARSGRQALV